ncbi:hypothetical protein [Streptomyces sp. NBC_00105]|uniref:hypothetical protein n=1 Tax=Streptomyces sp. NBC_00105 TaxID=2903622 RepID=UPI00386FAF51
MANADGTIIRQTFDERGNRTSLTTSTGAVTTFGYAERGHVVTVTNPLGAVTRFTTNAAGLPVTSTGPLGATSRFERDAFGRPVRVTDPLGGVTIVEWTPEGRPARRVDPDGAESVWTYDGEGNCTAFTDPAGGVTRFEYTHFDLLAARTEPDGVRYEYTYDALLRVTGVRNPQGLTWEYVYDATGRLTSETDFDGLTLTYSYDPAGRLRSRVNGLGEEIAYERDVLGRIVRKTSPTGTATFEFDVFDLPAAAVSSDGTRLLRIRDRHGRLVEEQVDGRTVRYAYDGLSQPVGMATPTGAETRRTYDAGGHCSELTASGRTLTFERDAAGRELTRRIGDSPALHHTFDVVGRLTTRHVTGSNQRTLLRRGYSYRADGNLLAIDDEATGPRAFTLDSASRVTAVDAASWSERYAYDEAGNQTSAARPERLGAEATGERAHTGTRITRAGRVRYEHDAQGRVILRQKTRLSRKPDTWHYTWDADDRLTEVTTPNGTHWRNRYDARGCRAAKQRLASTDASRETSAKPDEVVEETVFTWDGPTLIEQTTRSAGNPHEVTLSWTHSGLHPLTQAESIRGASQASQEEIDSRFFAIVTDLVGTPTELIDEQGEEFNMVIPQGQTRPGGFGDVSLLQRFRISGGDPILVQESIIGPQMDPKPGHLPGGGTQMEIMEFGDRARLIPVGPHPRRSPSDRSRSRRRGRMDAR